MDYEGNLMIKFAVMIGLLNVLAVYGCTQASETLLESSPNPTTL